MLPVAAIMRTVHLQRCEGTGGRGYDAGYALVLRATGRRGHDGELHPAGARMGYIAQCHGWHTIVAEGHLGQRPAQYLPANVNSMR